MIYGFAFVIGGVAFDAKRFDLATRAAGLWGNRIYRLTDVQTLPAPFTGPGAAEFFQRISRELPVDVWVSDVTELPEGAEDFGSLADILPSADEESGEDLLGRFIERVAKAIPDPGSFSQGPVYCAVQLFIAPQGHDGPLLSEAQLDLLRGLGATYFTTAQEYALSTANLQQDI